MKLRYLILCKLHDQNWCVVVDTKCVIGYTPKVSNNNNIKLINFDTPGSSFSRNMLMILEIKCVIFDTLFKFI